MPAPGNYTTQSGYLITCDDAEGHPFHDEALAVCLCLGIGCIRVSWRARDMKRMADIKREQESVWIGNWPDEGPVAVSRPPMGSAGHARPVNAVAKRVLGKEPGTTENL